MAGLRVETDLVELVHSASAMPANARRGLWPPGKGVRQGTRVIGTDVDNRIFTENVKIRA